MARPTKLTPEIQEKILEALRGGNYREVAGHYAGVPADTIGRWMRRGGEPYEGFRRAVLEAERGAEILAVKRVMDASAADPDHAKWWLERKFPQRWARQDRSVVRVEGEIRQKGIVLVVGGTPEQYVQALRRARNGERPMLPSGNVEK